MKNSTIKNKTKQNIRLKPLFVRHQNKFYKIIAVLFWLIIWQSAAMIINNELFLASPVSVLVALFKLCGTGMFWLSVGNSFYKITLGFLLALTVGILLSVASYNFRIIKEIISPAMSVINATPIASFILLVTFLVTFSSNIPIVVCFIMVLPVIYTNILTGLTDTDKKLLEMASVFKVKRGKKLLYIFISNIMPYFVSACNIALGMCWKSGIAAEVIANTKNSIGNEMYLSKIFLQMKELLAWTVAVIIISVLFQKLFMFVIRLIKKRLEEH